jgi:peptidoglycan/LPS O-acetylase OafA/YrhL
VGGFLRNRALRILVPLVAGWLILYPVLVFLWMTGVAKSGRWDLFGIPSEFRSLPPWQLTLGLFVSLEFLKKFDLTHLWFLHQLLVLYVAALAVRWCALHSQHGPAIVKGLDACFRKLLSSRLKVLWLALLVFPALYLQHEWGVDTPKQSLIPELPATSLFAIFFATGWAIHRQAALLEVTGRFWGWHLAIGILITAPSAYMLSVAAGLGWLKTHWVLVRVVFCLVYGLMMWGFVLGCLGWFLHCRRTESRAWRYIADSSYWVYLAHLPVIVALQIWVAFWPQSWILKFPLILLIAIPLLFASYHFLVRPTFIGLLLNGRRYPLRPAPQAEPKPSALLPT